MKTFILILLSLTLMACSQKSDVVGIKAGDEYYALDHDAREAVVNKDSDEKLVCRRTQKTGSHFKTRRCTTRAKLEQDRKDAREVIDSNSIQNTRGLVDSKDLEGG